MQSISGKWALVTGASSGFGKEFADLLAAGKANLVLAARRTEPMEALAAELRQKYGIQVVVEGVDLARAGMGGELKARFDARGIAIDILLNNAGYGIYGDFLEQPMEKTLNMIQLNVTSLTELTYVFGRDMAARGSGHILLVASILGFQPSPGYSSYAATKAYVLNFGEALHTELKPRGVGVTVLCPGLSATSFTEVSGGRQSLFLRMMTMKARPVAEIGLNAMFGGRACVVAGFRNKMTVFFNRLTPRLMQRTMMQKILSA
jgi:short-subunit dehydrogenase